LDAGPRSRPRFGLITATIAFGAGSAQNLPGFVRAASRRSALGTYNTVFRRLEIEERNPNACWTTD
jgi:hypothetical protein